MLRVRGVRVCYSCKFLMKPYTDFVFTKRQFGKSLTLCNAEVKEVEIPVPWGKIAARHWNAKPGTKPILLIHGWKDNAASFDKLIPLLVKSLPEYQYLAVDLPGHGRSSHFPPGMMYLGPDVWALYYRILDHFNWKKISIIGHSMGAEYSLIFTGTHPQFVEKFVALDALIPYILNKKETIAYIPVITTAQIEFERKLKLGNRPTFTYDEILKKLMKSYDWVVDAEACRILMTRGIEEYPPGSKRYRFSHDARVHYMPLQAMSCRQISYILQNFKSDILKINADEGRNYKNQILSDGNIEKWLKHDCRGIRKRNIVKFLTCTGNHYLHILDPESISPYICQFLSRLKT